MTLCLALLLAGVPVAGAIRLSAVPGDSANYAVSKVSPAGWDAVPHGPQTLFLFRNPKTGLLLRGAANQIVADFNPTPDLHTDGIAQHFLDRTKENMPEWNVAKTVGDVEAPDARFRLIRRERPGKCVITAFAVKGNTTVLVTLSGNQKETRAIDRAMPEFCRLLKGIRLTETVIE